MKTKIVYCFIASGINNIYQQLLISLYTVKINHRDVFIEIVCDNISKQYLDGLILQFIDNVIVCEIPEVFNTPQLKSRYLKTSLRNIIDGDYLFIDTDTFVVANLTELDNVNSDISAVYNGHYLNTLNTIHTNVNSAWINTFGKTHKIDFNGGEHFNSGIMLVKDNMLTRDFYKQWHNNWLKYYTHKDYQDEPTLILTNLENKNLIQPLDAIYNCQLPFEKAEDFVDNAKIYHYISSCMKPYFLNQSLDYISEHYIDIQYWLKTYWKINRRK